MIGVIGVLNKPREPTQWHTQQNLLFQLHSYCWQSSGIEHAECLNCRLCHSCSLHLNISFAGQTQNVLLNGSVSLFCLIQNSEVYYKVIILHPQPHTLMFGELKFYWLGFRDLCRCMSTKNDVFFFQHYYFYSIKDEIKRNFDNLQIRK